MVKNRNNGWKPVRRGAVYCSPQCGFNCTHADYLKVRQAAKAAVADLGAGWKASVWENAGWHWSVSKGHLTLHQFGVKHWWADLKVPMGRGEPAKQVTAAGVTAREAVKDLKRKLARLASAYRAVCEELQSIHT